MAITDYGTIYVPSNSEEIRASILEDLFIGLQKAGVSNPAIEEGSDNFIFATAMANALLPLYASLQIAGENTSELTATGDALDDIREAIGLPEVEASGASGKLIVTVLGSSPVTILDGSQLTLPNGLLASVIGTSSVSNNDTINVVVNSVGEVTNTAAGAECRFLNPPNNVATVAVVDIDGLTGGIDTENDDAKRQRILLRRRDLPAGGNIAYLRDTALSSTAAVQNAYVYPALGGPGTVKVVVTKAFNSLYDDYSRELTDLTKVEVALLDALPVGIKLVVQSAVNESTSVGIMLDLPTPATGEVGFKNTAANIWPKLESTDNGRVSIVDVTSTTEIEVNADTATAPTIGVSEIMWFCSSKKKFVTAKVTDYSGSAGAWTLTLDTPLIYEGVEVVVGEFVSPAITLANDYVSTLLESFNTLAPGENTNNPNINTGSRGAKRPVGNPALTNAILSKLAREYDEINNFAYSYRSVSTPTIPTLVSTAPNVLTLNNLGFYYYNEAIL